MFPGFGYVRQQYADSAQKYHNGRLGSTVLRYIIYCTVLQIVIFPTCEVVTNAPSVSLAHGVVATQLSFACREGAKRVREKVSAKQKTFRVTTSTPRLAMAVGLSDMGILTVHSRTVDHPTRLWVRSLLHAPLNHTCVWLPTLTTAWYCIPGTS